MSRGRVPGDRAFVEVKGTRFYLGSYGSEESHRRYARFIAEWDTSASGTHPEVSYL